MREQVTVQMVKMEKIRNIKIKINCFLLDGDYVWFVPVEAGMLCRYHLKKEIIDYIQIIPGEIMHRMTYTLILKYEEKLILVPYFAKEVVFFNTKSEEFIKIELPERSSNYVMFDYGVIKGKYLYMFPGRYPYVIKLDLTTFKVWQSEDIYDLCSRFFGKAVTYGGFSASAWDGGNALYAGISVLCSENEQIGLARIDLDTLTIKIKKVSGVESWIKGMVWNEGRLYIYSVEGQVTILDDNMNNIKSILDSTLRDYDQPSELNIMYNCVIDGKLYFIRSLGLKVVVIDLMNNYKVSKKKMAENSIVCAGEAQGGILFQTEEAGGFYIETGDVLIKKTLNVRNSEIQNCLRKWIETTTDIMHENVVFSLQDWMEVLELMSKKAEKICFMQKQYTRDRIYRYINFKD